MRGYSHLQWLEGTVSRALVWDWEARVLAGQLKCPCEQAVRSLGADSNWLGWVRPVGLLHLPAQDRLCLHFCPKDSQRKSRLPGLVPLICLLRSFCLDLLFLPPGLRIEGRHFLGQLAS